MILLLKILAGVAAVALGVYLGLPGRYEQSQRDLDRAMDSGKHSRHWTKRHFTPLDLLRKDKRGSERRRVHQHFKTAVPTSRPGPDDEDGPPRVSLR